MELQKEKSKKIFDLYPEYTEEQVLGVISTLNNEKKRIIELKYGFNGNTLTKPKDIAKILNIDVNDLYIKINAIRNQIERRLKKGQFKRETIFDLYPEYNEKQILGVISTLNKENKKIIELKYGLNGNDFTETKDIAKECNTTVTAINSTLWSIHGQIKRKLEKRQFRRETIFDLYPEYSEEQILGAISTLTEENKTIINLKYGLNENEFTETKDIASKLNETSEFIHSRLWAIQQQIGRRLKKGQFKKETIFDLYPEYTEEQVLKAISNLSDESKKIIDLRYGITTNESMSNVEIAKELNIHRADSRVYSIRKQIEKRLKNRKIEIFKFQRQREHIKNLINMLNNPIEQCALLLRLGYIHNKYYTKQEISKILNMNVDKVDHIINVGLSNIIYLSTINNQKLETKEKTLKQ